MRIIGGRGFLRQVQLPRNAITIIDPRELAAKAVFAQRHQFRASRRERTVDPHHFVFGSAVDKERKCGSEGEAMFYKLSVHRTVWFPMEKVAFMTDPSGPGWFAP